MKFLPTELPGVVLIEPVVHRDERGFFLETYVADKYERGGLGVRFVQDNHSCSMRNSLRGLHAQLAPRGQGKLIRVVEGEIFDVAVDIRVGSPSFGRFAAATLSADNFRQLFIPPGFAHGFCVSSERAQVEYKCTAVYDPSCEIAIAWNDPEIGIPWPLDDPILSPRDRAAPRLAELRNRLPRLDASGGGS